MVGFGCSLYSWMSTWRKNSVPGEIKVEEIHKGWNYDIKLKFNYLGETLENFCLILHLVYALPGQYKS